MECDESYLYITQYLHKYKGHHKKKCLINIPKILFTHAALDAVDWSVGT